MSTRTLQRSVSLLAFGGGVATAIAVVAAGWLPVAKQRPGLDLKILANRTGELAVSPAGAFVRAKGMEPSDGRPGARGKVKIANETAVPLAVRVRALSSLVDTDRVLHVRIRAGRAAVFDGTLGDLRRWSARSIPLGVGSERTLEVRAWLEPGAGDAYRGRIQDITLDFASQRVQGRAS
jgi:hypothetical protein